MNKPTRIIHFSIGPVVAVLGCLILGACASIDSITADSDSRSTFTVEDHSFDEVWDAAIRAVETNLTIISRDKSSGVIKASSNADVALLTMGEVVGVFIISIDKGARRHWIAVVSEAKYQPNLTSHDWRAEISTAIRTNLGF